MSDFQIHALHNIQLPPCTISGLAATKQSKSSWGSTEKHVAQSLAWHSRNLSEWTTSWVGISRNKGVQIRRKVRGNNVSEGTEAGVDIVCCKGHREHICLEGRVFVDFTF